MAEFDFTRLAAFQIAAEFVATADDLVAGLPSCRAYLADQMRRAATSIVLNIAEGAGEFSPKEKARFYRMAKRSAVECAALLSVLERLDLVAPAASQHAARALRDVISLLTRMILNLAGRRPSPP